MTGGNAGIGKAIAVELADRQAPVVIVSRNAQREEQALADIRQLAAAGQVDLVLGELGSIAAARQLAQQVWDLSEQLAG